MIRFQETAEKKDNSEPLSSIGFQDIKPTGTLSNEEAMSFLSGLFSIDPETLDMFTIDEETPVKTENGQVSKKFGHSKRVRTLDRA